MRKIVVSCLAVKDASTNYEALLPSVFEFGQLPGRDVSS